MNNFTLQYPIWFIFFCIIAGLCYAGFLYIREKKLSEHAVWKRFVLGLLRFLAVFGISFLLLGPLLKINQDEIKNPSVVIVQDASSSVSNDSQSKILLNTLKDKLGADYLVDVLHYSNDIKEGLTDTLDGNSTNMSNVFSYLDETYANQNLGAVIFATDGIFNEGENPIYQKTNLTSPFYFIPQGDTTQQKDISIKQLYHNKIAYLGDKFIVQCDVQAYNFQNTNTNISLFKINNGQKELITKQAIQISSNSFFTTFSFEVPANQVGNINYSLDIEPRSGEFSTKNNARQFYIDILDARQKILILANSPHPDLAALKNIITTNKNYEVTIENFKDSKKNFGAYDLVIFHNLPSKTYAISNEISSLNNLKKPRLFIAGSQISIPAFNQAQSLIAIKANTTSTNLVQAKVKSNFKVFEQSEDLLKNISKYPPLISMFGEFTADPNTSVLLNQKIGDISTEYPLLAVRNQSGIREAVLAGEGIWEWRLYNFLQKNNFDEINELINKTIQYVTIKEDKRKFRVSSSSNVYKTYDKVGFDAELYNDSYEKVNDVDAFLTIKDKEGREVNYTFSKIADFYQLDAGTFTAGNYSFVGSCNYGGKALISEGKFSVQDVQLELLNTTADHSLLNSITSKYGGELMYNTTADKIVEKLKADTNLKPIIYSSTKTESVLNLKWILFLLIGLLFAEWIIRRLLGTY